MMGVSETWARIHDAWCEGTRIFERAPVPTTHRIWNLRYRLSYAWPAGASHKHELVFTIDDVKEPVFLKEHLNQQHIVFGIYGCVKSTCHQALLTHCAKTDCSTKGACLQSSSETRKGLTWKFCVAHFVTFCFVIGSITWKCGPLGRIQYRTM